MSPPRSVSKSWAPSGASRSSRDQQILPLGIAPERVNVRMLEQQQRVWNFAGLALRDPLRLQPQPFGVSDGSELFDAAKHEREPSAFSPQLTKPLLLMADR